MREEIKKITESELFQAALSMNSITLKIARLIGEPINESLPVPLAISEIADTDVAEVGEKVWYFANRDDDPDEIYYVDTSSGVMTVVKRSPVSETELTFQGLNSRIEYVLVDTILSSVDNKVLARKKERIAAGLDKLELKLIIDAVMASADISTIAIPSGGDLYDTFMTAKHQLEDYGDNFLALVGSTVKEKIDTYDKDKAGSFYYRVGIKQMLTDAGIKTVKIFGSVKTGTNADNVADTGVSRRVMSSSRFILVARNSTIADGKPLHFVRRKISADIAKLMGANVDTAQRATVVLPTPVNVAGSNTLGYGIYAYESIIWAVKNRKAIVKSANLVSII